MRESGEAVTRRGRAGVLDGAVALSIACAVAFWETSFHVVPALSASWRGMSGAPSAMRIGVALVMGILGSGALARLHAGARRPLLALLAAALPLVPVATGTLLPLLVFQGGVMRVLVGAVVAVALVRLAAASDVRVGDPPAVALFAAAFFFYCAWGQRVPGAAGPQGDEPHYLVMAQSLLSDRDLDLTDEFANREYAPFYGGALAPHTSPNTPPGQLLSMHSPGFPVLLLPAYAAGGYRGARVMQSAFAALFGVFLYRLVRDVTKDARAAAGLWAVAVFTPPLAFYAVTLYPETPTALAIVAFLLTARAVPGWRPLAAATALAVVLPWVHTKSIPLGLAGLGFTLLRAYRWSSRLIAIAATAASLALLAFYFQSHYGSPSPRIALGPSDVAAERIPWGLTGAFFDRQYGLLPVAPALMLAIPGAVLLWRRRTGDALRAATLALLVALPAAAYIGWWGGAAPPARYVLPIIGPLILAVAMTVPWSRDALAALGGAGLVVLGLAADAPRMLRNRPDGESLLLRSLSPDVDLNAWLPSFLESGWRAPVLAVSLVAAAAIAWRWRGRGLVVAALGYALIASGVRDRPLIDQGQATQRLLAVWEGGEPRGLAIPFELPRRPWTLDPGEGRNARRIMVPPGAYDVEVRAHALDYAAVARIEVHAGELVLGEAVVSGDGPAVIPLLLPAGGRGLGISAYGVTGRSEIDAITIVPRAVIPRGRRDGFDWPEYADADHYRRELGGTRVTALDRASLEDAGFRVRGASRFLVEAPAGAPVRMTIRSAAGTTEIVELAAANAVAVGRTAIFPVLVPAADAFVIFAVPGR